MNKKLLFSLSAVLLTASLVAGASFAEFSSQVASNGNNFTAGTLTLLVDGSNTDRSAKFTLPNMKPGDEVTRTIKLSNSGSIDANKVLYGFRNVVTTDPLHKGANNILDKIVIKDFHETIDGHDGPNIVAQLDKQIGNDDGILTLKEYTSFKYGRFGFVSWDGGTIDSGNGITLEGGDKDDYAWNYTLQLPTEVGNDYQGTTASFDVVMTANQNSPTDGLAILNDKRQEARAILLP